MVPAKKIRYYDKKPAAAKLVMIGKKFLIHSLSSIAGFLYDWSIYKEIDWIIL
jgi:hypothetical protein